jgi:hypothetical protein
MSESTDWEENNIHRGWIQGHRRGTRGHMSESTDWEENNIHRGWIQGHRREIIYTESGFRVTGGLQYSQRVDSGSQEGNSWS